MEQIINEANILLYWLYARRNGYWAALIESVFPEDYLKQIANVNKLLLKLHGTTDVGIPGAINMNFSTAIVEAFDFILPSHIGYVYQALKDNNRILQLGRGKGKMLVILNSNLIPTGTIIRGIDPTDGDELSKAVAAQVLDVEVLVKQNQDLKKRTDEAEAKVAQLQDQINIRYRTTWT